MIDAVAVGIGTLVLATVGRRRQALANQREAEQAHRILQLHRDEQLRYQRARLQLHDQIIRAVHDVRADANHFRGRQQ